MQTLRGVIFDFEGKGYWERLKTHSVGREGGLKAKEPVLRPM